MWRGAPLLQPLVKILVGEDIMQATMARCINTQQDRCEMCGKESAKLHCQGQGHKNMLKIQSAISALVAVPMGRVSPRQRPA